MVFTGLMSTNRNCPAFSSHQENAAEQLGLDPAARHNADDSARIDALAEAEYRICEGH